MRLAEHHTAVYARCKQCLTGRGKPDVPRSGTGGMQGSMVMLLRPTMHDDYTILFYLVPLPSPSPHATAAALSAVSPRPGYLQLPSVPGCGDVLQRQGQHEEH